MNWTHRARVSSDRRKQVLLTIRLHENDANPYAHFFASNMNNFWNVRSFNWVRAIVGRHDIVHFQWPEYIFRGSTLPKAFVKYILSRIFLMRLTLDNTPVILTVHNLTPHEPGNWFENDLMMRLDRLVVSRTYLNEDPTPDFKDGVVILHGSYPSPVGDPVRAKTVDFLFFGQVRPYKGIERLIEAFKSTPGLAMSLTICGVPLDAEYAESLQALARTDQRIRLDLRYVNESELRALIAQSRVVVLPYRTMYNSGAALLSLCQGAQILVPTGGSTAALQREMGSDWVELFEGNLSAGDLERCRTKASPAEPLPSMDRRDWNSVTELQSQVYSFCLLAARQTRDRKKQRSIVRSMVIHNSQFVEHSALNARTTGIQSSRDGYT